MNNEILRNIEYNPNEGSILFKDVRYLIIRPETVMEIYRELRNSSESLAADTFFNGGFTGGKLSSTKFKSTFGFTDREIVDFMATMGTEIGWGKFDVIEFDPDRQLLVMEVLSSPFAQACSPSPEPVCHLIRGVLAGMCTGLFERVVTSAEESCLAKGDPVCRFRIL